MWEALKVRNNLTKTMAIVLFVMAITLVTVGCAPKPVEDIDTPTTANAPVSTEPKPAPPIETKSPRALELEALLEKAPKIDGLTKFIEDDKIIYKNSEGVKSGYYVVKAYYNGEETDGVSLSAEVIEGIVSKNREEGLDGSLAMPVDPSEDQIVKVDFLQEKLISNIVIKCGIITISTDKQIIVANSLFGNGKIEKCMTAFMDNPSIKNETYSLIDNGDVVGAYSLYTIDSKYENITIPYDTPVNVTSGDNLGKTSGDLLIIKIYKTMEDFDKYFIYESDILKIGSSLVFCMVNESR